MKNNSILLLKNLLLSTSSINKFRYCRDKKKRSKIVLGIVGMMVLYLMLMAYMIITCIGFGKFGLIDAAPNMCAVMISALAFIFTFLKTNGYLFNFKEYDMLMSLPFAPKTIAGCKFLYMYINSLPWYVSISLAMMIGYGIYAHPAIYVYPLWMVLSLFIPVIPMVLASFIGFLIAKIGSGFKKKNIIQTVLAIVIVVFGFSIRFIIEDIARNNKIQSVVEGMSGATDSAAVYYPPVGWFSDAISKNSISGILLLTGVSILLFAVVFYVVGRSYRRINSSLKSHTASKDYRISGMKKRSVECAVAFKEFKRMTGSTTYMTNGAIGEILVTLVGIVALFIGPDRIISMMSEDAPVNAYMLQPMIPFVVYFFVGMVATTACSPSLEGKNYWIVQSIPIDKTKLYRGKMLFNLFLTVPFMLFSILCLCISFKTPVVDTILYLILGLTMCAFSTAWGCVCGIRHMRLDWENEIEVVKQGTAMTVYLLPNMFVTMILAVGVVFLGMQMDHRIIAGIFIATEAVLAAVCYSKAMALARKQ